ncbi:MAG: hypothetical protein JO249_22695 [Acidobacteria bacterium]|nr:hypothetical protein [Acidobacteriota bacterium]MBV9483532.1 hypothetical protein [Acidobacteriota bacterium]
MLSAVGWFIKILYFVFVVGIGITLKSYTRTSYDGHYRPGCCGWFYRGESGSAARNQYHLVFGLS